MKGRAARNRIEARTAKQISVRPAPAAGLTMSTTRQVQNMITISLNMPGKYSARNANAKKATRRPMSPITSPRSL